MRYFFALLVTLLTLALVYVLSSRWESIPEMGPLLSPQHGFWQLAEPADQSFSEELDLPGLQQPVEVLMDDRLVPHIRANSDADAYYVQGYLHARFRLWQMDFSVRAAAGRVSEIIGERAIAFDREQRRLGMVYGAEKLAAEMEKNELTRQAIERYTAGINDYIRQLGDAELPIEYRLLGFQPELWSTLKSALFAKQMSKTLAGHADDLPMTRALQFFSDDELKVLFPDVEDSLAPIIPRGTPFDSASVRVSAPASADSIYLHKQREAVPVEVAKPNKANGSNNWAVHGSRTQSGRPILANDPHLDLRLPAIWYEMQLMTPTMNAYGVSFPGLPGIVIGWNENIAFGFTNAGRDLMDYYQIRFKDDTKQEYWFDSSWRKAEQRIEVIKVKGGKDILDTVAYTVFGPVTYDKSFQGKGTGDMALALSWTAHLPSNELLMWYYLDRAKNLDDYQKAIRYFSCPPQNMIFASREGDIAIAQQGVYPVRWNRQGLYVMPGEDSTYMWKSFIPFEENPRVINPERGFIESANQRPVDASYPYFIPGSYDLYRGIAIERFLGSMTAVTPEDMMKLQRNNYNVFAETARPLMLRYLQTTGISGDHLRYVETFRNWNLENNPGETAPTIFQVWYDSLEASVWKDEWEKTGIDNLNPSEKTLVEALLRDSSFRYLDDIRTPVRENLKDMVTSAFRKAAVTLDSLNTADKLSWGKYKNTTVYHLLQGAVPSFARSGLPVGGGRHIINATQHSHGPSWKMVVHLTDDMEARVVYPGGQSGNPGSRFYDNFVDTWAAGQYYDAWFIKRGEEAMSRARWVIRYN